MQKSTFWSHGGAGYIGSHTVISLIENGYAPVIVDDLRNSHAEVIGNIEKISGTYNPVLFS